MCSLLAACISKKWGQDCSKDCPECLNGGVCHDGNGDCICPPGFMGTRCETGRCFRRWFIFVLLPARTACEKHFVKGDSNKKAKFCTLTELIEACSHDAISSSGPKQSSQLWVIAGRLDSQFFYFHTVCFIVQSSLLISDRIEYVLWVVCVIGSVIQSLWKYLNSTQAPPTPRAIYWLFFFNYRFAKGGQFSELFIQTSQ